LELTRRLDETDIGPEATLWVLVNRDVGNLCLGPHNLGVLQLLPEARADQFAWFWRRRERLFNFYRRQIRNGVEAGLFPCGAPTTAPDLVFGLVESVITVEPSVRADPSVPASVADAVLRMLGVAPARLQRARRRALQFLAYDPHNPPASARQERNAAPPRVRQVTGSTGASNP
jgi:hypothetical protein